MKISSEINVIVYHNNIPVDICKPDYIGLTGMHITGCNLMYPPGSQLEIIDKHKHCIEDYRVSTVVTRCEVDGVGLMLANFNQDHVSKWRFVMAEVMRQGEVTPANYQ